MQYGTVEFQTSVHLQRLCILLCLPLHSSPHSEKILSTYACEAGAERTSSANAPSMLLLGLVFIVLSEGQRQSRDGLWLLQDRY